MTKKELLKNFNYYLTELEKDIEKARQKEIPSLALEYTAQAIGFARLAFFLDIIDYEELCLLNNKFYDYYYFYYDLVIDKFMNL